MRCRERKSLSPQVPLARPLSFAGPRATIFRIPFVRENENLWRIPVKYNEERIVFIVPNAIRDNVEHVHDRHDKRTNDGNRRPRTLWRVPFNAEERADLCRGMHTLTAR